jgi:predicted regulator of Ras-like GTPase activity (Roadblock/LC7/MglB family)
VDYLEKHANAFDPDEVRILAAALNRAWAIVQASGAAFDGEIDAHCARDLLAASIVEAALLGERNVARLYEGALAAFTARGLRQHQSAEK